MSWTDERVDTLKQLWHQGFTASQIAERLGNLSRNAVIGKAHRLGLSGRPSPIKGGSREDGSAVENGSGGPSEGGENTAEAEPTESEPPAGPAGSPATAAASATPASPKNEAAPPQSPTSSNGADKQGARGERSTAKGKAGNGNGRDKPSGGASILDLNDRICKWPIGDPRESDFRFCGGAAVPGLPYCAEHAAQAYQSMPRALDEDEDAANSRPRA